METAATVMIFGPVASGKTQIMQMLTDVLREKGIAFIAIDEGDVFGFNGTDTASIKGVVQIQTTPANLGTDNNAI